ncbi:MAG: peptide chain release factor family protein [Elusimicrobiota bacterium]
MKLSENFGVQSSKMDELLSRMTRLGVDVRLISESFSAGGGPGGQKINKTSNCVRLFYSPLDLSVRVQRERKRALTRFLALRELVDQIEMKISPETSRRLSQNRRARRRKLRRKARALAKYKSPAGSAREP